MGALSNPPERSRAGTSEAGQQDVRSLGGTDQKEFGPRGKGRSQVAFMPRSVAVQAKKDPAAQATLKPMSFVAAGAGGGEKNGENPGKSNSEGEKSGKSNSDFRKMLLGE